MSSAQPNCWENLAVYFNHRIRDKGMDFNKA